MKFGLNQPTIESIQAVFTRREAIEKVIIYGSRAMGKHYEGSDIDLVILSDSLSFTELLKMKLELNDLMIPYKVDLSLFGQIRNNELIDHINTQGKVFYLKEAPIKEK